MSPSLRIFVGFYVIAGLMFAGSIFGVVGTIIQERQEAKKVQQAAQLALRIQNRTAARIKSFSSGNLAGAAMVKEYSGIEDTEQDMLPVSLPAATSASKAENNIQAIRAVYEEMFDEQVRRIRRKALIDFVIMGAIVLAGTLIIGAIENWDSSFAFYWVSGGLSFANLNFCFIRSHIGSLSMMICFLLQDIIFHTRYSF